MKHQTTLTVESIQQNRGACIRALFSAAAILLLPVVAHSQNLLLNFGNETITNWNKLGTLNADIAAGSVIDDGGALLAGVAITTNNFASTIANATTGYASGGTPAAWVNASAPTTAWLRSGGSGAGTVLISGLNDSLTYSLNVVSARSSSNTNQGLFTANGLASSVGNSASFLGYQSGWVEGQVLTWNSLTPTSGSITLNVIGIDNSNTAYINALQLTATSVPEPSSYAVLLGGVSMMAVFLRKPRRV